MEQRYALPATPAKRPTLTRLLVKTALLENTLLSPAHLAQNVPLEPPTTKKGNQHVLFVQQALSKMKSELFNVKNVSALKVSIQPPRDQQAVSNATGRSKVTFALAVKPVRSLKVVPARTVVTGRYLLLVVRPVLLVLPEQKLMKITPNAKTVEREHISQLLVRLLAKPVILKEDNTKRRAAQHTARLPNRDISSTRAITQVSKIQLCLTFAGISLTFV
jgi:hypothetical protein